MNPKIPLFVGLDLGGNHVKVGLGTGRDETLIWDDTVPSRVAEGRDAILVAICDAVRLALSHAASCHGTVAGLALGTPGVVGRGTGEVLYEVSNLPDWKGVNFRRTFDRAFGLPSLVDNDANVAAFAEATFGAGRSEPSVVMVTVGTGIGGGAVIEGTILRGDHGAGMELGHIPRIDDGVPCGCGRSGCLESYAGGRSMHREWLRRLANGGETEVDGRSLESLELRDLIVAAERGDAVAVAVLEDGARHLGIGLVTALHLVNPSAVVLGGGIVDGCSWFADRVESAMRQRALPKATDRLTVRRAQFGNRAGVIGAIALCAEEMGAES